MIRVELPGDPRGKGRQRSRVVIPKAGKPFVHIYPDPETVKYETALKWCAKAAMRSKTPMDGPLRVVVTATMAVPKSWPKKKRDAALSGAVRPTGKPDGDNFLKAGLDALNQIVWNDDAQVVDARVIKVYGETPSLVVEAEPLDAPLFAPEEVE